MKWPAQKYIVQSAKESHHSEKEWDHWFAWRPVVIATGEESAHWVWLEFVERTLAKGRSGAEKWRYRLQKPHRQKLHKLAELTRKIESALQRRNPRD